MNFATGGDQHSPGRRDASQARHMSDRTPAVTRKLTAAGRVAEFFSELRRRIAAEAASDLEPVARPESAEYTAWTSRQAARTEEADRLKRRLATIEAEAKSDVRPKAAPDDPDRIAWYARHVDRERRRLEIEEARLLTTNPTDPAPFAEEGLAAFIAWSKRQESRRRFKDRAAC
jgi:hypothetical protein